MKRILVIRGGAIGDFILTLPAIKLLRGRFSAAHLEILGHPQIIALAENRFYARATRSIEYGPFSSFFSKEADLSDELAGYFRSFDLIVSYLFDSDRIFETNVRRCGATNFIFADPKIHGNEHAARQLARPLEPLGLELTNPAAELYPSETDRANARAVVGSSCLPIIALHPGSGSQTKNWPIESWIKLGDRLLQARNAKRKVVLIGGEADELQLSRLQSLWKDRNVLFASNLALPILAALLERALFVGHDSGISHLAAAAGAECVLLFGPTEPAIWAPQNKKVQILQAPKGDLHLLSVQTVAAAVRAAGRRIVESPTQASSSEE